MKPDTSHKDSMADTTSTDVAATLSEPTTASLAAAKSVLARPCSYAERTRTHTQTKTRLRLQNQAQTPADTCAIIAAGGSGVRFGDPRGKQFVPLCGLPLMSWSLLAFDEAPSISSIVVVCAEDVLDDVREKIVSKLHLHKPVWFAIAGATRQDSCYAGLLRSPVHARYVAIHDAARPLIQADAIERVIARVRAGAVAGAERTASGSSADAALTVAPNDTIDGAILAHPATDTLNSVHDKRIQTTPPRADYWCAETPQVFKRATILQANHQARVDELIVTDDASLMEQQGYIIEVVPSVDANFKVTVPEDLILAEVVLQDRIARAAQAAADEGGSAGNPTAADED